ncbi:MAG: ABC transporter substrate-binding protein [Candidatus Rokubacteria bacterium]|nr:ABC transporter substrate-binding protein [Candidatus Rokubacteria bacterium]
MKRFVVLLLVGILALGSTADATAQAKKTKIGVLKLTSSAVLFLGVEKGYFKEFGIDPDLVFFQAAQPVAVALASGDIDVGATGLTAGLYNTVAGGVKVWIVADKGREWPGYRLTAILVQPELYETGLRSVRDLRGKTLGITQIGSTFHYSIGNILEKEGLALGDVELVPLQSLGAMSDALAAKRVDAIYTAQPFVSGAEAKGVGKVILWTGDVLPWQVATIFYSGKFAQDRERAVNFMKGYIKAARHYYDAVLQRKEGRPVSAVAFEEAVAVTAKYKGAKPEIIKLGFPYQDRDGRLLVDDIAKQLAWWRRHNLVKAPIPASEVVDTSFFEEGLRALK